MDVICEYDRLDLCQIDIQPFYDWASFCADVFSGSGGWRDVPPLLLKFDDGYYSGVGGDRQYGGIRCYRCIP